MHKTNENMTIADNIRLVNREIEEAACRAGRDPSEVTLVAVTKTRTAAEIDEAAEAGIMHFGENRVREAMRKIPEVIHNGVWHLIGPLQSNKGKHAATLFDWIDSIHSIKIADILSSRASESGHILKVLIQVNISGEESKSGVSYGDVRELVSYVKGKDGLDVKGLMTIGSFGAAADVTISEFAAMRDMFKTLREDPALGECMEVLSMGMSGDYQAAVEYGSTMVRVGTAIFGKRR